MFQQRGVSEDVPVVQVAANEEGLLDGEGQVRMPKLLVLAGLASSAGEATRKLGQNLLTGDLDRLSDELKKASDDREAFEVHDLVLAKLGRNMPRDREDVAFLIDKGALDRDLLIQRFHAELRRIL